MELKGVSYDVGRKMGGNWRPDYDPALVHREFEIIRDDLHCNAVRICGCDIRRLTTATSIALELGLEVWLSPELWNRSPDTTLRYLVRAASAAEDLRSNWPNRLTLVMNSELTLFMKGIIPGSTFTKRLRNTFQGTLVRSGSHNAPLNLFLGKATDAVRSVFHGQLSYASLIWEQVDWRLFDFIGVDHYWDERIQDRYVSMLQPLFKFGKPVVITEFGFNTTTTPSLGATSMGNVNNFSRALHQLPIIGRTIKPRLAKINDRNEDVQAQRLISQLQLLNTSAVHGAFIFCFVFPLNPYNEDPRYDLDRESPSLVKSYPAGKHGVSYPDMTWEPKASFRAVANFYGGLL